jgi:hypothetical protein
MSGLYYKRVTEGCLGRVKRAVFIVGSGRSGTTMLGSMLGAHPKCIVTPESQFNEPLSRFDGDGFDVRSALKWLESHPRFRIWDMDIGRLPEAVSTVGSHREFLYRIVEEYSRGKHPDKDAEIWVDHTPSNVKKIVELSEIYPDALFIHIYRDGRAVAASRRKAGWRGDGVVESATVWMQRVGMGFSAECMHPDRVFHISYENLVTHPEKSLKRISDFAGIDFSEEMVSADGFIVPGYTKHQHTLVGKRPDISRIDAWREYLDEREIEIFENIAGEMLGILGYERLYDNPRRIKRSERVLYALKRKIRHLSRAVSGWI